MIVIEKNKGEKIPYEVSGKKICFDDDLQINLQKRQDDSNVHIDICYDPNHELQIGTNGARAYVAEIDIPAKEYETTEDNEEVAVPLDMDEVKLSLWAI